MNQLQVKNLSFKYFNTQKWIFKDFSFFAENGDIVTVKGSSGSGKTTLLNILCSVIPKVIKGDFNGQISVNTENLENLSLPQIAPKISLLMQEPEYQLFFPTVEQELAFAPENLKINPQQIHQRITQALAKLNIKSLRYLQTASLSYGQKKLVTLASILTLSPDVFLLDEPFAGISKETIHIIKNIIQELAQSGKIIFIVDHSEFITKSVNKTIDLDILNENL